jgi:hypothetical protein
MKKPRRKPPAPGELYIVDPREVAKSFRAYYTDPEILLGCMIVSGTPNTAEICRAEIHLANDLAPATGADALRYENFRRVWKDPTPDERAAVLQQARAIARDPHKAFTWPPVCQCGAPYLLIQSHDHFWNSPGAGYGAYKATCTCEPPEITIAPPKPIDPDDEVPF